uniref:Uncharacterized protein n=1 Tax=Rangifer tarandus platyrhynchus TaxID=3082113 RepID=A0ACB0EB46_RANTA|nr:unnamed protein product [Rangifer tarandus platyrhynchus]
MGDPTPDSGWPRNMVRLRQARQLSPADPGPGSAASIPAHHPNAVVRAGAAGLTSPDLKAPPCPGLTARPQRSLCKRLHRAPAARLLVWFSAEAGPGTGQSTAVRGAQGPSPHPQPCPSGSGCRGDCLARRQEVDVNGANARGPEEGRSSQAAARAAAGPVHRRPARPLTCGAHRRLRRPVCGGKCGLRLAGQTTTEDSAVSHTDDQAEPCRHDPLASALFKLPVLRTQSLAFSINIYSLGSSLTSRDGFRATCMPTAPPGTELSTEAESHIPSELPNS